MMYVWGLGQGMQSVGCGVWDTGCGVQDAGCGIWGVGCGVWGVGVHGVQGAGCGLGAAMSGAMRVLGRPGLQLPSALTAGSGRIFLIPPDTAPSADYTSRHPAHRKWASPRGRGFRRRPRGGASRAKMAAAAVLEFQRAQSLLSTDREASIGILHSIGEPRGSPRSLGRLPADPRPLRPAARPAADSRRGAACWARGGGSGMAGIGVGAGWGLGFAAPRGVGL